MRKLALICCVGILLAVVTRVAVAQLDVGSRIYLIENGEKVGEVYVPPRSSTQSQYEEHWVLYPGYRYPGPLNLQQLIIKAEPSERPYANLQEFLTRVPWTEGSSKYIRITATESSKLAPIR